MPSGKKVHMENILWERISDKEYHEKYGIDTLQDEKTGKDEATVLESGVSGIKKCCKKKTDAQKMAEKNMLPEDQTYTVQEVEEIDQTLFIKLE